MARDDVSLNLADRRIPKGDDFLSADELRALTPAELLRRLRALAPTIAASAAEAEQIRRPVDEVWRALRRTGFFYQFIPKRFGGMETDFDSFIDASLAVAEADASLSWVATFCAEHNWILSHFPVEVQEALWGGDFPYIIAPYSGAPTGKATKVDGGYVVNGQWQWGTGVMHADWVMLAVLAIAPDGPVTPGMALIPASEIKVLDTWRSCGMAATGSNDIVAEGVFVPEVRLVLNLTRSGRVAGERPYENPIYGVPLIPFLTMSAAIPALGAAKAMVRIFQDRLSTHFRGLAETKQVEKPAAQIRLAKADLRVRSAEALIRRAGRSLLEVALLEEPDQTPSRIAVRAELAYAVALCREAAILLTEGGGTSLQLSSNPFQRNLRDLLAMSTHIVFDEDVAYELHGRALVGLPPNAPIH